MKGINTSIYDFPTLRDPDGGYIYVDKTAQLYEIAKPSADRIYYLPRPRRFGKSLMISTLKALFQGRRELFRGLAIEKTDWNWEKEVYPVLHLDMSQAVAKTALELEGALAKLVRTHSDSFGLPFDDRAPVQSAFADLLRGLARLSPGGRYVVLIDEYDAPITGLLDTPEGRAQLPYVRGILHDFYVQAKAECGNMRFLMVTGVSKVARTSIFSAFNNPCDLTFDGRAADLLGYTHEEMELYFHEHIQGFADRNGISYDGAFAKLLEWYDSYQFSPRKLVKVVNPVSLGKALTNCAFGNYWESTAGSTLIFEALKRSGRTPADFAIEATQETLEAGDILTAPTAALLYQGGYLTIDGVGGGAEDRFLTLRIPNMEVRQSLERGYVSEILGRDFGVDGLQIEARRTAERIEADPTGSEMKRLLVSAYSRLPHDWACKDEKEAKRYFLSFMVFTRAEVVGEEQHALGRPDAVLRTGKGIYIFEFKYGGSAKAALEQCRERRYADAFTADPRPVTYIGVNYNPARRTVDEVECERSESKFGQPQHII